MQAKQVLRNLLARLCPTMHNVRRAALGATAMAALREQPLTVIGLGRAIDSEAKEKHDIKRADRVLSNPHLYAQRECVYQALITGFMAGKQ